MRAYSCYIILLLFSSILQLVKLFGTHKNKIFEVDVLTGNSVSKPQISLRLPFSPVKMENHWLIICVIFHVVPPVDFIFPLFQE